LAGLLGHAMNPLRKLSPHRKIKYSTLKVQKHIYALNVNQTVDPHVLEVEDREFYVAD
jgi:hypothetical protein